MSFGENIQFLRKRRNMTQEDFAEQMDVSRQTVSKWESDASYPETDKIIQICNMFSCSMDTLLRGSVEDSTVSDTERYDHHYNQYIVAVVSASGTISIGLLVLVVLLGFGVRNIISVMTFMVFVIAAMTAFIINGINHGAYVKKHPNIKPFYRSEEIESFNRKYPFLIAIPTALILFGVVWLIGFAALHWTAGLNRTQWNLIVSAPIIFFAAAAVPVYIYARMQKNKYDVETYNQKNALDAEIARRNKKDKVWCGVIMLTATIVFVVLSFIGNLWAVSWITFPIGGILCGIVPMARKKID